MLLLLYYRELKDTSDSCIIRGKVGEKSFNVTISEQTFFFFFGKGLTLLEIRVYICFLQEWLQVSSLICHILKIVVGNRFTGVLGGGFVKCTCLFLSFLYAADGLQKKTTVAGCWPSRWDEVPL